MNNKDRVAMIRHEGRQVVIVAPYDSEFVSALKSSLKSRRWNPQKKAWVVAVAEREKALELTKQFFSVVEEEKLPELPRQLATDMAEAGANITAEWLSKGKLEIWTDGACSGNPGPGGYGIVFSCGEEKRAMSGGFRLTTNNRMEIMAAIVALETLPQQCVVVIYSDSQYVVRAVEEGWAKRWRSDGWMRNKKEKAINADLWERLLQLCEQHDVKFRWVKGHDSQTENEWCDQLAEAAARRPDLPADPGYRGSP